MNLGELIVTLGVDTAGLDQASAKIKQFENQAERSVNTLNQSLEASGKKMQAFGRQATMYLTVPLSLVGGAAFNLQKSFESSLSKVNGLVGISKDQVDAWGKDIINLSPQLAKAPAELSDALYFITSAGIRGAEAMDVLTSSAQASTAGLGETNVVADLVTSAMNAYGKENLSAAQATDVLVAAVREGKAEAPALAASLGMVLPVASAMQVSFDEVGAAVASMTRTGTDASTAAVQLRQILASLLHPSKQAESALHSMGISSKELRDSIKQNGLLSALMQINDLTKVYGEEIMGQVFPNIRALTGILDIMGSNLDQNIAIFNSLKDATGSLDRAFEAASQTTQYKFDKALSQVKSNLTDLGKTVSSAFLPVLQTFADMVSSVTRWFKSLDSSTKTLIVSVAGFAAVLGPLSITLGFLVGNVLPGLLTVGTKIVTMFRGLSIVAAANPWFTALAVGITAVVVAIKAFTPEVNKLTQMQTNLNSKLSSEIFSLNSVFQALNETNPGTKERADYIKIINDRYGDYLSNLLTEKSSLEDVQKAQEDATKALVANISVKSYKEQLQSSLEDVSNEFDKQFSSFMTAFSSTYGGDRLGEFITALYEGADKAIKSGGGKIERGTLEFSQTAAQIYQKYVKDISKQTGYLKYDFQDFQNAFLDFTQTKAESNQVVDQLQAMINAYTKLNTVQKNVTTGDTTNTGGNTTGVGTTVVNAAMNDVLQSVSDKEKEITTLTNLLGSAFDSASAKSDLYSKALSELVAQGVSPTNTSLIELVNKLRLASQEEFNLDIAKSSVEDLKSAMDDNIRSFDTWFQKTGQLQSSSENINQVFLNTSANIAQASVNAKRFGESYDYVGQQIDIYKNALQQLQNIPGPVTDEQQQQINDYIQKVKELGGTFKETKQKSDSVLQSLSSIGNSMNSVGNLFGKSGQQIISTFNSMLQLFVQLIPKIQQLTTVTKANSVATQLQTTTNQASVTQTQLKMATDASATVSQQTKTLATQNDTVQTAANSAATATQSAVDTAGIAPTIAKATADTTGAMAAGTKSAAKMPFPANLVAIASVVAAITAAMAAIPQLANGGIVPPGYPNDSFPAMLQSNEAVIPLNKYNLFGNNNESNHKVLFKLKGNTMQALLDTNDKITQAY